MIILGELPWPKCRDEKRPKTHDANEERVQCGGRLAWQSAKPHGHVVQSTASDGNVGCGLLPRRVWWFVKRWIHEGR